MRQMEEAIGALFPVREGRFQPIHKSVVDWLTGGASNTSLASKEMDDADDSHFYEDALPAKPQQAAPVKNTFKEATGRVAGELERNEATGRVTGELGRNGRPVLATNLRGRGPQHPWLLSVKPGHRLLANAAAKLLDEDRLTVRARGVVGRRPPEMYALHHAAHHLDALKDVALVTRTLLHAGRMLSKAEAVGGGALAADYTLLSGVLQDPSVKQGVKLVQQALTLSQEGIREDPWRLPLEMFARMRDVPVDGEAARVRRKLWDEALAVNEAPPQKGARCPLPHGGSFEQAGGACLGRFPGRGGVAFSHGSDDGLLVWETEMLSVYDRVTGALKHKLTGLGRNIAPILCKALE